MRRRVRYGLSALAGVALAAGAVATAATAIPTHNSDDPLQAVSKTLTSLTGSLPNYVNPGQVVGALNPNQQLPIQVALPLRNQGQAQELVKQLNDPSSPNYGKYLSAAQFNKQFAPSKKQVEKVANYLKSKGLKVQGAPDPNNHFVNATGTVSQLQKAFDTTLKRYKVGGQILKAPSSAVKLPKDVAQTVTAVLGLSDSTVAVPGVGVTPEPDRSAKLSAAGISASVSVPGQSIGHDANCPYDQYWGQSTLQDPKKLRPTESNWLCPYSPAQIRSAYGLRGHTGKGQTVAIIDAYNSKGVVSDANRYSAKYGLPAFTSRTFVNRSAPPRSNPSCTSDAVDSWNIERAIDIDAVHTTAPDARIMYYGASDCGSLFAPLNTIIAHKSANIISNSWDFARSDALTQGEIAQYNNILLQAAAEGIGVYFCTLDDGDETVSSSYATPSKTPQTWFPSSSPYATAVGGTSLGIGSKGQRVFETGWESRYDQYTGGKWQPYTADPDFPKGAAGGAGGGVATAFTTPSWQKGAAGTAYTRNHRVTPDVAALADWSTGFVVGYTPSHSTGTTYGSYSETGAGGTSLATPLIAGIVADAQQSQHRVLGFLNPALYKAMGTNKVIDIKHVNAMEFGGEFSGFPGSPTIGVDFDIKLGTLQSHAGWDNVTGVGVPNGAAFLSGIGK